MLREEKNILFINSGEPTRVSTRGVIKKYVPVVATNVDGCLEVVVDGETGVLVPPANPDALARAICRLLKDEALRVSMAKVARARVVRVFSQERNLSAYVDLYQNLVVERVSG